MDEQSTTAEHPDAPASAADTVRKNIQSTIEFPYADLEAVVELAEAIRANAGSSCEDRELAGWLDQSVDGGTYRSRRSSARHFGLVSSHQGRLTLTALGQDVTDSEKGPAARAAAFLLPELYAKMYELHGGKALPPAAAIERQMGELGVSPKQKERARQVFHKSATFAGFIDQATGRFIKPGNITPPRATDPVTEKKGGDGGGNDGGDSEIDPIIRGLLVRLPKSGEVWSEADRKLWLDLLAGSFKLIYKDTSN